MDKKIVSEISKGMIKRYSDRYNNLGYDVKTLGWGSTEQQLYRFSQVVNAPVTLREKSIVDIGCGFGDLGKFLLKEDVGISRYLGLDINPDLINEAAKQWKDQRNFEFRVGNIIQDNIEEELGDVGVMLGVLNLNFKDQVDNISYSREAIKRAYNLVKEVLIVDFLSARRFEGYPKEDFVYYHDPLEMLEFAFSLSNNVVLKHEYAPIPQKEFMLLIFK
jgi:SAM-dependent methyltransferase